MSWGEKRPELEELKPGDKVTLFGRWNTEIRTVAKVTKTSITDDKGSKWTMRGRSWGTSDRWSSPHINAWIPADDQRIVDEARKHEEKRMRAECREAPWHSLPIEIVRKVHAMLPKEPAS